MLRYVILVLLDDGQAKHGYALMKEYRARSGVRLNMGNVYRELQRLKESGLIADAASGPNADPRRVSYAITARGRQALAGWLAQPAHRIARTAPDALFYRLVVLDDMTGPESAAFLDDLHETLLLQLKQVETERRMARTQGGRASRDILLERQALHLAADIQLVGEARARLEDGARTASKDIGAPRERDAPSPDRGAGRSPTRIVAGT
jgi:DNA-binding PadR family transcriptional regulator